MKGIIKQLIAILIVLGTGSASAKTFRLAGLYAAASSHAHPNCTCSVEASCITEAAVKRARAEGVDISYSLIQQDWNIFSTIEAAKDIVSKQFDATIGTIVSSDALVAAPIFEEAGIPFIVPMASHPDVTAGRKLVTRVAFNDFRQSHLLARLTATELKPKKIAVIRNASLPYSDFLGKEYAAEMKRLGHCALADYPIIDGFTDFKGIVEKAVKDGADFLFLPLSQVNVASIYVALVNQPGSYTILTSDTVEGQPAFLSLLGPKSPKIRFIYPKHWNHRFDGPEANRYLSLQRKSCKQFPPSMPSVAAYDAIELLIRALKKSPNARGAALVKAIRSVRYHGMTGKILYGEDGDPIKPLELFQLDGERAVYWKRYE